MFVLFVENLLFLTLSDYYIKYIYTILQSCTCINFFSSFSLFFSLFSLTGLYHGLIPVMNLPFLNAKPAQVMFVTRVIAIMSKKLTFLPQMAGPPELKLLALRCKNGNVRHHAFPIVRSNFDKHLIGLLSKKALLKCLDDLKDPIKRINLIQLDGTVDMTLYCDRSPLSVDKATTVARAYEVFTKLGLRHLVVKGHTGKAEGMLTRKDLMLWRISAFKEKELKLQIIIVSMF